MNKKEYGPLIDDYSARSDQPAALEGGLESNALLDQRSRYGTGDVQMSELTTAGQRASQRQGRFQGNASDIERISALPPQQSVYQQIRSNDPSGKLNLGGIKVSKHLLLLH